MLKRTEACGFHERNSIKISDLEKDRQNIKKFIIPTISTLDHISTIILTNEEEIKFWQTGRAIKIDINLFNSSNTFDSKKPLKVIDKRKNLLGIGFFNEEHRNINPKLVLNAK